MNTILYYEYTRAPTLSRYLYKRARTNKNNTGLNHDAATVLPQPGKQDGQIIVLLSVLCYHHLEVIVVGSSIDDCINTSARVVNVRQAQHMRLSLF